MSRSAALVAAFAACLLLGGPRDAFALKDSQAREELEVLRGQLNQVESALQVRQMGLGEQIQSIREELARIEARVDENRRDAGIVGRNLNVAKIETQESLLQLNRDYQKRFEVLDENTKRLVKGIEDLQKNIGTLSENLRTMSEFEQKQESRISQIQQQLQDQFKVVVEEVGRENTRLNGEITALRGTIGSVTSLADDLDGRLRSLGEYVDRLADRQNAIVQATQSGGGTHAVRQGETLSTIAKQYSATVEEIMSLNNISNPNLIRVGQQLRIP